jgi:hypothetical protein
LIFNYLTEKFAGSGAKPFFICRQYRKYKLRRDEEQTVEGGTARGTTALVY